MDVEINVLPICNILLLSFISSSSFTKTKVPNLDPQSSKKNLSSLKYIFEWTLDTEISLILKSESWPRP